MKKLISYFMALVTVVAVVSCERYDDSGIQNELSNIKSRLSSLEDKVNGDISSIREILNALDNKITIASITETESGWVIKFSNGKTVTVSNGGDSANAPVVGVKKDSDGLYYWTLDGQWLLDNDGKKIPVTGASGSTPQMKIDNGYWYISYDGGKSWTKLGKATGEDGDAFFKNVTWDDSFVYFEFADGSVLQLARGAGLAASIAVIPDYNDGAVKAGIGLFTIRFKVDPESAAESLLKLDSDSFKLSATYTLTKAAAGDLISLPIHALDAKDGILTITTDGENLSSEFANKSLGVSAALFINDGNTLAVNSGYFPLWPTNEYLGHEYVDLGLESGNKFASTNLGAEKPGDPGHFYAWGELEPKENYTWSTYLWCNGTKDSISKYNGDDGFTSFADDNYNDDIVRQEWGGEWRTPTEADWQELMDNNKFKWTWIYKDGSYGYEVTSKKSGYTDQSIFLPVTGVRDGTSKSFTNKGYYWSSSLSMSDSGSYENGLGLNISSSVYSVGKSSRALGMAIRPVVGKYESKTLTKLSINPTTITLAVGMVRHLHVEAEPQNATIPDHVWGSSNWDVATVSKDGMVTAMSPGTATIMAITYDDDLSPTCTVIVKDESELAPEAVDLGLPSGIMWASKNVGATVPEDYGDYFAWGETEPYYEPGTMDAPVWKSGKTGYNWPSYKWTMNDGIRGHVTKYTSKDHLSLLEPQDDAATVTWGDNWRTPTSDELVELHDNCSWRFEERNGVRGLLVTSKIPGYTDKSIFLPQAGSYGEKGLAGVNTRDQYWTSSGNEALAYDLISLGGYGADQRSNGYSIRPVYGKLVPVTSIEAEDIEIKVGESLQLTRAFATILPANATDKSVAWECSDKSIVDINYYYLTTGIAEGTATLTAWSSNGLKATCKITVVNEPAPDPKFVDMGLSVKWATCNIGASKPEEFGDYFAWGDPEPYYMAGTAGSPVWKDGKSEGYDWPSYKWCLGSYDSLTKYCLDSSLGTVDNLTLLDNQDDIASAVLGEGWRMPTRQEMDELLNPANCSWTWTEENGVNGFRVTSLISGHTDASIFIPAAGCLLELEGRDGAGEYGQYWTRSLVSDNSARAWARNFYDGSQNEALDDNWFDNDRCYGLTVRAVKE